MQFYKFVFLHSHICPLAGESVHQNFRSNMAASIARSCCRVHSRVIFRKTSYLKTSFHCSPSSRSGLLLSLHNRGLLKESFPEHAAQAELPDLLRSAPQTVYCGFDRPRTACTPGTCSPSSACCTSEPRGTTSSRCSAEPRRRSGIRAGGPAERERRSRRRWSRTPAGFWRASTGSSPTTSCTSAQTRVS